MIGKQTDVFPENPVPACGLKIHFIVQANREVGIGIACLQQLIVGSPEIVKVLGGRCADVGNAKRPLPRLLLEEAVHRLVGIIDLYYDLDRGQVRGCLLKAIEEARERLWAIRREVNGQQNAGQPPRAFRRGQCLHSACAWPCRGTRLPVCRPCPWGP